MIKIPVKYKKDAWAVLKDKGVVVEWTE